MSTNTILATAPLATTGFHLKATGTTIGNSLIWDNGTNVGIGNTNTSYTLDVSGTLRTTGALTIGSSSSFNGTISNTSGGYTASVELGYRLRNDANSANLGGFTRRSYWVGGSALDTQIFAETGYGIYLNVNGSQAGMAITSAGNVGIGTMSPTSLLTLFESTTPKIAFQNSGAIRAAIQADSSSLILNSVTGNDIRFQCDSTERMRIGSNGTVTVGNSAYAGTTTDLYITGDKVNANGYYSRLMFSNSSQSGSSSASIRGERVGGNYYTELSFYTNGTNSTSDGTERMRISSGGKVMVNTTDTGVNALLYASASSSEPYPLGSKATTSSQGLVGFFDNANSLQGSISISGSTVSYNSFLGSHWSQLSDNSKPEILTGTILEAINELCKWDNITDEKLAKVKISDTIESKNVYGVFSNWDNTDDYNDMYVAAVGAGFIRVNSSSIVSMGDLLQSNGDGTAKIQSDDIMRSSTIAKVTSTQKIITYDDGSYLIAATLHCG